jgi:precorrin-6B methylase 2
MTEQNWWTELYDDLLADVLLVRTNRGELEQTIAFLIEKLALRPNDRVFDQCFGVGSLAIELAARGMVVSGVEQAARYVERALEDAKKRSLSPAQLDLVAGDARAHVPKGDSVRGAFNWWTSFGYSEDDADNARMIERAFESLEPGGHFLLDTMNLAGVLRSFQEEVTTRRGGLTLVRRTKVDLARGVMTKRWSYVLPDGNLVEKPDSVVRLYLPHTLVKMLETVGFEAVEIYGDIDGHAFRIDSPRCILRGRKPQQSQ